MPQWIKLAVIFILLPMIAFAQTPDSVQGVRKKPLRNAAIITATVYGLGLAGLHHMWYRNSETQSFRFFNDNAEWKQVDKVGHAYSAFYLSYGFSKGLQHYGVKPSKADLTGSILGFAVLVPIEIFDGFSNAYGASVGDLIADGAGAMLYFGQARLWNEVRLRPKFSFRYTPYSEIRPELLGTGLERIIKDYNGQTYWLSVDLDKFFRFPKFLNIAVGYGAQRMIYARDEQHGPNGYAEPYRQYYLALDFDFSSIKSRSKVVKTLLFVVDMFKLPAPTLELSNGHARWHALYF